eukprot:XP_028341809.1 uncharacterized protein LOC114485115 [Physeter catodon]
MSTHSSGRDYLGGTDDSAPPRAVIPSEDAADGSSSALIYTVNRSRALKAVMWTALDQDAAPTFRCRHCEHSLQDIKAYMGGGAWQPQVDSQANALPPAPSSTIEPNLHDALGELQRSTAAASCWPAAVDSACVSAAKSANDTAVGGRLVRLLTAVQSDCSKQKSRKDSASSERRRGSHSSSRKDKWLVSLYGTAAKALRDEPQVVEVAVDIDAIVREALASSEPPDAILCEGMPVPSSYRSAVRDVLHFLV